jgi:CHAT domain-containing protein
MRTAIVNRKATWLLIFGIVGVAGSFVVRRSLEGQGTPREPASGLIAAGQADSRTIEARLSGASSWSPFREQHRDKNLASAMAGTLRDAGAYPSADGRHAEGVAQLLIGQPRAALASLSAAAESTNDAGAWNDLAVAFHETAIRHDAPELFAEALAAADRALSRDASLPEGRFNRALILEHLGLNDDARIAWEAYLVSEPGNAWAVEAREHHRRLAPPVPFLQALDRTRTPASVAAMVRDQPQQARTFGEQQILGRWGAAVARNDPAAAGRNLALARILGDELQRRNGDRMLQRAVAAIDAGDEATRTILAAAHVDYDEGLTFYQSNRPNDGEARLLRAAAGFERGGSPMKSFARLFASNAAFDQGRHDEGQRNVEALLAGATDDDAFRALLLRELGVCHATSAAWGDAIRFLDQSAAIFDHLGETQSAASVRRVISDVYDRTGDPATAWKFRMLALRSVGERSDLALEKAVKSIAGQAVLSRKWQVAESFLTLEIEISRRIHDDVQGADALLTRAIVRHHLHDLNGVRADLADAAAATERSKDPAYRDFGRGSQLVVRAMLAASPSEATGLLTDAIAFQAVKGDRMNLPGLYLLRGRAFRSLGDQAGAASDFERGIAEIEKHRQSLPEGEARWGAFYSAEELFEDAVDLAIERNDVAGAFAIAERERARALLEAYGSGSIFEPRRLAPGTVLVEYMVLPARLIAFVADSSGIDVVSTVSNRDTLTTDVDKLVRAFRSRNASAARNAAAGLHERLIEPIAARLASASHVVFVSDVAIARVPFSALIDKNGAYLVEHYAITVSPSAAVFAAAAARRSKAPAPESVVVVGNPEPGAGAGSLAYVTTEARQVARIYRNAASVPADGNQLDILARLGADADVLHFAGHAVGDESGFVPASLILRDGGHERRVSVEEIAHLRLKPTATVVLAGCNTARGERRASEGVISVAHGFLTAGASSVIATLWPIDDRASAQVFPRLHQLLARGVPPAEALRAVQLESIRRGDVPMSFWAALQSMGN